MGLTAWSTIQTKFSTSILFAMKVAQNMKNQMDGLRGGLRQLRLLLDPRSRNLNRVAHWIHMSQNAIAIAFANAVAL
jgi:hypothetical protein